MDRSTFWKGFFRQQRPLIILGSIVVIVILYFYLTTPVITEAVLASAVRHATPLVLGAMCGLLGERAGIINIGIEGQMLLSAFIGFLVNAWSGNLLLAVFAGVAAGAVLGLLLAFMSVTLKIDQIIGGTVINIIAVGLTGYFYQAGLTTEGKLAPIALGKLAEIPIIGRPLFNNPPITYATIVLVFVVHYVLFYTRWGLRTRAVGEHPKAADTLGVNVYKIRYINVILGGAIAGLAGAFLTLEAVGSFERLMTNGRGFVALAYELYVPLAIAGFGFGSGQPHLWPDGLVVFGIHLAVMAITGTIVFVLMGIKPLNFIGYTLGSVITILGIVLVIGLSSAGAVVGGKIAMPTLVPTATQTATPVPPTLTPTNTPIPPTPSPSPTVPTATATPQPTATSSVTPKPTPFFAEIAAPENDAVDFPGASIRSGPSHQSLWLTSLLNGVMIEILNPSPSYDEAGGSWLNVRFINADGNEQDGWIRENLILISTPQPDW